MGAGARQVLAQLGTTVHGACGCPAHRRLKAEPVLLSELLNEALARKSQHVHVCAAAAQGFETDLVGAPSMRRNTVSSIFLAAGSGPPSRLERRRASALRFTGNTFTRNLSGPQ